MINRQEIFEKMVTGLYRQGKPSVDLFNGFCKYRGDGGTKCAIGFLIDDSEYDPSLEGSTPLSRVMALFLGNKYNFSVEMGQFDSYVDVFAYPDLDFLTTAQRTLHDNLKFEKNPVDFRMKLISAAELFADSHGLNRSFINALKE